MHAANSGVEFQSFAIPISYEAAWFLVASGRTQFSIADRLCAPDF